MTTLLVLDNVAADTAPAGVRDGAVHILSFHPDPREPERVAAALDPAGATVSVASAAGTLDSVALDVRERFTDLVAGFPAAFPRLMERTTFRGDLALWWLHELSGKRSDRQPTFTRLCQLEVIRRTVAERPIGRLHLLSDDDVLAAVLQGYAAQCGLPFESSVAPARSPGGVRRWLQALRSVARDLAWFSRTALQGLIARVLRPVASTAESTPGAVFFSHYPNLWRGTGGRRDEKYMNVPEAVAARTGSTSVLLTSLASDGRHQRSTLPGFVRSCIALRRQREHTVHLLDAELGPRELFAALWAIPKARRFASAVSDPGFDRYWRYDGIPVGRLVAREFETAARRIPRYLLVALQVRRYVRRVRPARFVTYHFEFCYGRAIIYGVLGSGVASRVTGVQHGPFARRKLITYHRQSEIAPSAAGPWLDALPGPHQFIVEGVGARDRLVESGYAQERVHVGGAPRVKRLQGLRSAPSLPRPAGQPRVLVAFGQHDAPSILAACAGALRGADGPRFLFKLHPRSGFRAGDVASFMAGQGIDEGYEVVGGSVYDILPEVNAVVGTYSSVVMEAAALGLPVVCLQVPDRVNTSPILDLDAAPGVTAAPPQGLAAALRTALENGRADGSSALWSYFFGPDGESAEARWGDVIAAPEGAPGATRRPAAVHGRPS